MAPKDIIETIPVINECNGRLTAAFEAMSTQKPPRIKTKEVKATWRHDVQCLQTELSLIDWLESLSDEQYIQIHGLYVTSRDMNINRAHEGVWQVAENYQPGTRTIDASDGLWVIVGDDKEQLIKEALGQISAFYKEETNA